MRLTFTFIYMLAVYLIIMKFCIEKTKHTLFSYYSMVMVSFFFLQKKINLFI